MKLFTLASLSILMLCSVMGCSDEDTASPSRSEALDFNVIGDDAPSDFESAMQELLSVEIMVPDPVQADDPALSEEVDLTRAARIIDESSLDEEGRLRFRRIVGHLHDQFQMLRRCMNQNDDPRLRRLAYGAAHAYLRGIRALQADQPRIALRYFHQSNRVLNLAIGICRGS